MEYWNPKGERSCAEELKQLQERKLRRLVENAYEYSSFCKQRFAAAGVSPHDINIDYAYAYTSAMPNKAILIFQASDLKKAVGLLTELGFHLIESSP